MSEPAGTAQATEREKTAVLMITAGLLHHIGPNRMWVELAARVAEIGMSAFRFDLAGLGDSLLYESSLTYEDRSIYDIVQAMDYLQRNKGIEKFILIGFCSGAENAHNTGMCESKVVEEGGPVVHRFVGRQDHRDPAECPKSGRDQGRHQQR